MVSPLTPSRLLEPSPSLGAARVGRRKPNNSGDYLFCLAPAARALTQPEFGDRPPTAAKRALLFHSARVPPYHRCTFAAGLPRTVGFTFVLH